jgi:hypothetical protein
VVGYATQVSWVLIAAIGLPLLYELYRATAKAGTSKYDSMRTFLTQAVPSCAVAFALRCWCGRDGDGWPGRPWRSRSR